MTVGAWKSWLATAAQQPGFRVMEQATIEESDAPLFITQDSRQLEERGPKHCAFVAIEGHWHDGHHFLHSAYELGARYFIVSKNVSIPWDDVDIVQAPNSTVAWQGLAHHWRTLCGTAIIAITGSNGKTTVKEMVASIAASEAPVLATAGNLNNDIGVPLTLMRLDASHRAAVVEMGANHAGEIRYLCGLARPRVGVITQAASEIGRAHV